MCLSGLGACEASDPRPGAAPSPTRVEARSAGIREHSPAILDATSGSQAADERAGPSGGAARALEATPVQAQSDAATGVRVEPAAPDAAGRVSPSNGGRAVTADQPGIGAGHGINDRSDRPEAIAGESAVVDEEANAGFDPPEAIAGGHGDVNAGFDPPEAVAGELPVGSKEVNAGFDPPDAIAGELPAESGDENVAFDPPEAVAGELPVGSKEVNAGFDPPDAIAGKAAWAAGEAASKRKRRPETNTGKAARMAGEAVNGSYDPPEAIAAPGSAVAPEDAREGFRPTESDRRPSRGDGGRDE